MNVCFSPRWHRKQIKEIPAFPKAKAKAKALKGKTAVLKGIHNHTHLLVVAQDTEALGAAQIPSEECPWRKNFTTIHTTIKFSLTSESTIKKKTTHLYSLCGSQGQQAPVQISCEEKLHDIDVTKVNMLVRSDGEKKAYV
jgi:hypothetical protein